MEEQTSSHGTVKIETRFENGLGVKLFQTELNTPLCHQKMREYILDRENDYC